MKMRSCWRTKQILTFSGNEVYYYYTNEEYNRMKSQGYNMKHLKRIFVLTIFKFDQQPYSNIFPPF